MSVCPCCKYERSEEWVTEVTEKIVTHGKNKGKVVKKEDMVWKLVGDEEFEEYSFFTAMRHSSFETEQFLCCPKCGILFKE